MAFKFFPKLSQNLSQLLDDADDYNLIIKVGENSNTKEFHAHSIILKARSPYFKRALSQKWITKKNDMMSFTKPNISPDIFEMILKYLYTGVLDLSEKTCSDILDILIASDELLIEELITFVQKYLIENQIEWLRQNFVKVLHIVFQIENCKKLYDYCLESICEDPEPFFSSPSLPTLEKSILLELIERDDLQIEEIEIWNYLTKWGVAQTSELKERNLTNLSDLDEKDFLALKITLEQFILHIRFFEISPNDFYKKIWPYKKSLPEVLTESILSFYLTGAEPEQNQLPPRHGKMVVDSKIIKPEHATILANWTQRKEANARIPKDKKYNFDLIYRGSNDGYNINTILRKCNGQGACILVIKIKENGTVIGGYNPQGWEPIQGQYSSSGQRTSNFGQSAFSQPAFNQTGFSQPTFSQPTFGQSTFSQPTFGQPPAIDQPTSNYWVSTTESFIFSLGGGNDSKNPKLSRVVNSNHAIYINKSKSELNFGNSDLIINNNSGKCNRSQYECSILDTKNFAIEEMEIFKFYQG